MDKSKKKQMTVRVLPVTWQKLKTYAFANKISLGESIDRLLPKKSTTMNQEGITISYKFR